VVQYLDLIRALEEGRSPFLKQMVEEKFINKDGSHFLEQTNHFLEVVP